MEKGNCKVCVTGAAGYIGSSLVKKLLDKGYTVHATVRNLADQTKVGLLKSFPDVNKRLQLFEADISKPGEIERAIDGCEFVFHLAASLYHTEGHEHDNRVQTATSALMSIARSCIRSGTVRRLVYTASVVAASPLRDDGTGYKDSMDETCWTPLDLSFVCGDNVLKGYAQSKTMAEKEILSTGIDADFAGLEVVTLACGLVGGDAHLSYTPYSVMVLVSQIIDDASAYESMKFLEELLGKVPIVHIEDVCDAHIFSMEVTSISGRHLCASSYVAAAEIANYYQRNHPEFYVKQKYMHDPKREVCWGSTKLKEKGFEYKYDIDMILDDCVKCARKTSDLKL